jgi:hypothetical protein
LSRRDVVGLDAVPVAIDGGDHEMIDRANGGEPFGDLVRLRQIDDDRRRAVAHFTRRRFRLRRIAARQPDRFAPRGQRSSDRESDTARAADDDGRFSTGHFPSTPSRSAPAQMAAREICPTVARTIRLSKASG